MQASLALTLAIPCLAVAVAAQSQFRDLSKLHMPREGVKTIRVVLGDLDGDRDLDLSIRFVAITS